MHRLRGLFYPLSLGLPRLATFAEVSRTPLFLFRQPNLVNREDCPYVIAFHKYSL